LAQRVFSPAASNHPEGGMLFPRSHIDEIKKQEGRDLTRFDLDYDLPEHFLAEFPPPIYLTTRPDLGDVSQGKLVTIMNYYELFNGILNPKQLEGLRLLVTPFPQQQFNQTEDRRSELPSRGVTCLTVMSTGTQMGYPSCGRYPPPGVQASFGYPAGYAVSISSAVRFSARIEKC